MERQYYLNLAAAGVTMPLGADLILHEHHDPQALVADGERLGHLMAEAAHRYRTPLAFPLMNLGLEKLHLLELLEIAADDPATFHFQGVPPAGSLATLAANLSRPLTGEMQALCDALSWLRDHTGLLPVGMCIGPFSLMTKLLADPITPIALAGMGLSATEDEGINAVTQTLELAVRLLERYLEAQATAGARALVVCEPAANIVYLSPRQMAQGSDIFETLVMQPLSRLKRMLTACGVDLILHDCGELTDHMVARFGDLDPALLSLGSSRVLWEDARLLPPTTVLYGNLPSKRFYSDTEITTAEVAAMGAELVQRMSQAGHPFILGSECDILSVPGCEQGLYEKAMAITHCGGGPATVPAARPLRDDAPSAVPGAETSPRRHLSAPDAPPSVAAS